MYYRVVEATGSCKITMHGMPSKNSGKELEFKSTFRDGGYIILVEKPNKQGKSQSTAHPQHHPIPINCCTFTHPCKVGKVVLNIHITFSDGHTFALIHIAVL